MSCNLTFSKPLNQARHPCYVHLPLFWPWPWFMFPIVCAPPCLSWAVLLSSSCWPPTLFIQPHWKVSCEQKPSSVSLWAGCAYNHQRGTRSNCFSTAFLPPCTSCRTNILKNQLHCHVFRKAHIWFDAINPENGLLKMNKNNMFKYYILICITVGYICLGICDKSKMTEYYQLYLI